MSSPDESENGLGTKEPESKSPLANFFTGKRNSYTDEEPGNVKSSRFPGFYALAMKERGDLTARYADLSPSEISSLTNSGALNSEITDVFIENAIGTFSLPLGIATNFKINGKDLLVPMAVEESSVVAAASHGAKYVRMGGGFKTASSDPVMTGQIQLQFNELTSSIRKRVEQALIENKEDLIQYANKGFERLLKRGGGTRDFDWRFIDEINSLVIHVHIDTRDAMGANIVNTICEKLSNRLESLIPGARYGLRILTNFCDKRTALATCVIPHEAFSKKNTCGKDVAKAIENAYLFAYHDVYRATTNNKGVMNGIDPVVIATGNDWRAIEAAAHVSCVKDGSYRPLAHWSTDEFGNLHGRIEMPISVGTVGGVTKLHPTAKAALKLLGRPSACELAEIILCVGLAQNLSALRALSSEGIQKGHMSLHQTNLKLLEKMETNRSNDTH